MTISTSCTDIGIIFNPFVVIVDGGFVTVLVTQNTTEYSIVGWHRVAFGTKGPFSLVVTAVNWEILGIMVVSCWCPSLGGVTNLAVGWKLG
jgi:hypothetical protein